MSQKIKLMHYQEFPGLALLVQETLNRDPFDCDFVYF
jgi:hypothetical protein